MPWQCFHSHIRLMSNLIFACSEDNKALRIKNAWGGIYTRRVSFSQMRLNIFRYCQQPQKYVCAAYPLVVLHLWNQRGSWSLLYTASKVSLITLAVTRQAGAGGWDCVSVTLNHTMPRLVRTLSVLHRSHIWIPLSHASTSDSHLDLMVGGGEYGGGGGREGHCDYW